MHDLGAVEFAFKQVIATAIAEHAARITDLFIVVGELSGYGGYESVTVHLNRIRRGTIAEGATVHIRGIPAELQCMACFTKYHPNRPAETICPHCGSRGARILAGEEFSMEASYGQ